VDRGHRYRFPLGYFAWDQGEVLSFRSRRWPSALRSARHVELLISGTPHPAIADVISDREEKVALLAEFIRRKGPLVAHDEARSLAMGEAQLRARSQQIAESGRP
jgi:hypothetical protein